MDDKALCSEHQDEILWDCAMCHAALCKSCGAVKFAGKIYCKACIEKINAQQSLLSQSDMEEGTSSLPLHFDIKFRAIIITLGFFFLSSFSAMAGMVGMIPLVLWVLLLGLANIRFLIDGLKIANLFTDTSQKMITFGVITGAALFFIAIFSPFIHVLFESGILTGSIWALIASMRGLSYVASFLLMLIMLVIFIGMWSEEFNTTVLLLLLYAIPGVLFPFFSVEFIRSIHLF